MSGEAAQLTIAAAGAALRAKGLSALELTRDYLARIADRNPSLNAYLEVFEDGEREARRADELLARGEGGALTGIPLAVKDNILIEGRIASAASKMLEQYRAAYDATVIQKLKAEGAVFLGRTNMDEFAMGSSTEHSAFGPTRNPADESRVAGGSSGGSAAAVAADLALGALGSDTGGSVRQPAAFCGVVGLKPTYGALSRYGLIAMGSSLDQIGPLAKTVADAEILFDAIKGNDPRDANSLQGEEPAGREPRVIGVPRHLFDEGVDADVLAAFERALEKLRAAGYEIRDIELPSLSYALPCYYIVMPAEVSANLARFDGVRYGLHVGGADLFEDYAKSRAAGFGAEVRRRILLGTHVLSAGYYDAYYGKASAARRQIAADFMQAFTTVDAVATPTTPTPAFRLGEKNEPLSMYAADVFTVPANLTGLPALSVPMEAVMREGAALPLGFELTAPYRREKTLFTLGNILE